MDNQYAPDYCQERARCTANVTSGQCKVEVQDIATSMPQVTYTSVMIVAKATLRTLNCFPTAYSHPGLNSIILHSHQLKDTLSVHCKGLGEYNVNFGLYRPKQENLSHQTKQLGSVTRKSCKCWNESYIIIIIIFLF